MTKAEQLYSAIHDQIDEMVDEKIVARSAKHAKVDRAAVERECEHIYFEDLKKVFEKKVEDKKKFLNYLKHDHHSLFDKITHQTKNVDFQTIDEVLEFEHPKLQNKELEELKDIGFNWFEQKDYVKAYAYFSYICQMDQDNPQFWFLKGMAEHNLGHFDEALKSYKHAIILAPHYVAAHVHHMNCLIADHKIDQAKQCFDFFMKEFDYKSLQSNNFVVSNIENIKKILKK